MIFSCSMIEPGQPCVMMSGSAFGMLRTHVDEVDVEAVDLGDELRQGVQLRLALAPVVVRRPVARELLHRRELHALRLVRDRLLVGPARRRDAAVQVGERLVGEFDVEGADRALRTGRRRGGRRARRLVFLQLRGVRRAGTGGEHCKHRDAPNPAGRCHRLLRSGGRANRCIRADSSESAQPFEESLSVKDLRSVERESG